MKVNLGLAIYHWRFEKHHLKRHPAISSIALRQYHFTASVIGGESFSKSSELHQRMSWCSSVARVAVAQASCL